MLKTISFLFFTFLVALSFSASLQKTKKKFDFSTLNTCGTGLFSACKQDSECCSNHCNISDKGKNLSYDSYLIMYGTFCVGPLKKYLFKTTYGTFLTGGSAHDTGAATVPQSWEEWTLNSPGIYDVWALRSVHGTFLRTDGKGNVNLADTPREWEHWRFQRLNGRNQVCIFSVQFPDYYLHVSSDNKVTATKTCGPEETFTVYEI